MKGRVLNGNNSIKMNLTLNYGNVKTTGSRIMKKDHKSQFQILVSFSVKIHLNITKSLNGVDKRTVSETMLCKPCKNVLQL